MSFITRLVSRISPSLRRIRHSSLPSSRRVLPSPPLAQKDALCAFGRGFSTSTTSATSATSEPFLSAEQFLAKEGVKKVLANYKESLQSDSSYGVPVNWSGSEKAFIDYHSQFLTDFDNLKLYSPMKNISKQNYMALYIRGTLHDLDYLLYFLYRYKLKLSGVANYVYCNRLNELNTSHDTFHILRTDASVDETSKCAGYGILLTGGKEPKMQGNFSVLPNLPQNAWTAGAELSAIREGLELALSEKVEKVRILCDSAIVVHFMNGKKTVYEQTEEMMDILCGIGKLLKQFKKYSCNHIYREQNLEADYFASMGKKKHPVHPEDLNLFTLVPKFRLEGTFETMKALPQTVFPAVRIPTTHSYQSPAYQPVARGGGAPTAGGAPAAGGGAAGGGKT